MCCHRQVGDLPHDRLTALSTTSGVRTLLVRECEESRYPPGYAEVFGSSGVVWDGMDPSARRAQARPGIWIRNSLGWLYSTFTAFLGCEINESDYNVMGMAAAQANTTSAGFQIHWIDTDFPVRTKRGEEDAARPGRLLAFRRPRFAGGTACLTPCAGRSRTARSRGETSARRPFADSRSRAESVRNR